VPTSTVGGQLLSAPGLQLGPVPGVPRPPALRAAAWLVADLDDGTVVAACNAHVPLPPASTLKILTSLSLAHRLNWNARYVGQPADAAVDGTRVGIVPGSSYTVRDLFHGLMLTSGNDAATALATLSGGMPATAALMNSEAQRLGGFDTKTVNSSGLDAPGQVTSAYDLALFGRAALDDPLIARLITTRAYPFPGKEGQPPRATFQIQNHNALLMRYPGATGVKNGYTTQAGGTFVGSASRNGHRYLVSVLRAESAWRSARQLLDWAFVAGPRAAPVGRLITAGEVPALGAAPGAAATTIPVPTGAPGTATPGGAATATPAGATRAAAPSGSDTSPDARTGWIVLGTLGVLLLGGLSFAGRRGRRTSRGRRTAR
jgi:D-alanyl-D-alanine carboxypeptidase (penicillin-binding protein 5/6)